MNRHPPYPGAAPIEPLLDWESPAINDPARVDAKVTEGFLADPNSLVDAALWVYVTIASALLGNSVYDALKARLTPFLAAWRNRHGRKKLEELKRQVLEEIGKQCPNPQQGEKLRQAVEQLFERAEG